MRNLLNICAASPGRRVAALIAFFLLVNLGGTGSLPLLDRDEPRFAEASREMRARGDWCVPYFNNSYRFDKPPLFYWLQAGSFAVFGENDFAARFPSIIAGSLTALAIYCFGRRLFDAPTGWCAAVIFCSCTQALLQARAGVVDMTLVCFVTFAFWTGWEMLRGAASPLWSLLFYSALAGGFLTKGPVAWLPLAVVLLEARRLHSWRRLRLAFGLPWLFGLVACWGLPALRRTHGEYWHIGMGEHVVNRSFNALNGHGGSGWLAYLALIPFYFFTVFASFFPWSLWLPKALRDFRAKTQSLNSFLTTGIVLTFAVFTLVATKLPHYTLPAFPLLALLFADWWQKNGRSPSVLLGSAAGMASLSLALSLGVFPKIAPRFPAHDLFLQSEKLLRPDMEFASVNFAEPSLVWYFRRRVHGWLTPLSADDAAGFMAKAGARFCILPTNLVHDLFPKIDPTWQRVETRGFNVARGAPVDLTMLVKTD